MLGTEPQLKATYIAAGQVRLIFNPVLSHGDRSYQTHQAAECAGEQGRFWDFHNVLFDNQDSFWGGDIRQTVKQLAAETLSGKVDFRAIRFPGLISAVTVPSGGTSDFAPEMVHAAARGEAYACFVRPDTRIPFMVMPDAVEALVQLAKADRLKLSQSVYNITAFNPSAEEIRSLVSEGFPKLSSLNEVTTI